MPVKIRLQRKGRKKAPFYHVVIADARAPRDGKFIENIGVYDPMTKPATIDIDRDKAYDWLMKGAQPTDTVNAILRFKGVLYRKHLMGGVAKGALTEEQATEKYNAWIEAKEEKIREEAAPESAEAADASEAAVAEAPEAVATDAPEAVAEAEAPEAVAAEAKEEVAVAEETVEAAAEAKEEVPAAAEEVAKEEATEEVKEAGEDVAKPTEE
ncbi:UNVERIFIED_CONTAM: hypothetical protein GTU68_035268 [Idotea baltica]|nr:hypothetical protein [Idotea baltica]